MTDASPIVNATGALGGALLAICTLPQIYQMYKTKSADDVSLSFIMFYTSGLILTTIYTALIGAWAGAIPLFIEVLLSIVMIAFKLVLTARKKKEKEPESQIEVSQDTACCDHCKAMRAKASEELEISDSTPQ
ncbi:hypothetical protein BDR26DRAFT_838022 [Obelidium mucronatum]|nr:hypothetical protein BDR26DRAFT_838022 [Obelidium mucronatum]